MLELQRCGIFVPYNIVESQYEFENRFREMLKHREGGSILPWCRVAALCSQDRSLQFSTRKTALDRGRTDNISLTHDLDL